MFRRFNRGTLVCLAGLLAVGWAWRRGGRFRLPAQLGGLVLVSAFTVVTLGMPLGAAFTPYQALAAPAAGLTKITKIQALQLKDGRTLIRVDTDAETTVRETGMTFPMHWDGYWRDNKVFAGGENSLAVFALDPASGEPTLIQHVDTRGIHCRTFHIDPSGRMLVA